MTALHVAALITWVGMSQLCRASIKKMIPKTLRTDYTDLRKAEQNEC